MAQAVPHGLMHAVYINQFKAFIKLWCGEFKGLDSGTGNYVIPSPIWHIVGIETECAVKTIPAAFIHSIPNMAIRAIPHLLGTKSDNCLERCLTDEALPKVHKAECLWCNKQQN